MLTVSLLTAEVIAKTPAPALNSPTQLQQFLALLTTFGFQAMILEPTANPLSSASRTPRFIWLKHALLFKPTLLASIMGAIVASFPRKKEGKEDKNNRSCQDLKCSKTWADHGNKTQRQLQNWKVILDAHLPHSSNNGRCRTFAQI